MYVAYQKAIQSGCISVVFTSISFAMLGLDRGILPLMKKVVYLNVSIEQVDNIGFTEDQDREKIKTPRITDEGWNSQKRLSDPVEKKRKEGKRRKKRLLYPHPNLSSGLVPLQALLQNRHIACRKMVSQIFHEYHRFDGLLYSYLITFYSLSLKRILQDIPQIAL